MYTYFDNAATTPVDPQILDLFVSTLQNIWGNPSSTHQVGQKARSALEKARNQCAQILGCKNQEIYFASTATEANNIALEGVIARYKSKDFRPHVLISSLEHSSVSEINNYPGCVVEVYNVNTNGVADIDDIVRKIKEETILISLMMVSNEIGTIQPVKELCNIIKSINLDRTKESLSKILVHSDCVQAPLYVKIDLADLGVDLAVFSSHKLYAPRGCSVLFIKEGVNLQKIVYGGGQEKGLRSGTQNVAAIVCMAKALENAQNNYISQNISMIKFQKYILHFLRQNLPEVTINGDIGRRVSSNINITIPGLDEDSLLTKLDLAGFAVSSGSSCNSGSNKKSNISKILNRSVDGATIRISLGKQNTIEEISNFCKYLHECVKELSSF